MPRADACRVYPLDDIINAVALDPLDDIVNVVALDPLDDIVNVVNNIINDVGDIRAILSTT